MKKIYSIKIMLFLLCLNMAIQQVYGMGYPEFDARYNATTLFGDSEPLGYVEAIRQYQQEELLDLKRSAKKQLKSYDLPLKLIKTLAQSGPHDKRTDFIHRYNILNIERNIKARNFEVKELKLIPVQLQSRADLIAQLENELIAASNAYNYLEEHNNTDDADLKNRSLGLLKNLSLQHWGLAVLSNLNISENILVSTKTSVTKAANGSASKKHGNYIIKATLTDNDTLELGKVILAHEIGHVIHGDLDNYLKKRSTILGLAAITAPFAGYLSVALLNAFKNTKNSRTLALTGLITGFAHFLGGQACATYISQANELRADNFAYEYNLKNDNIAGVTQDIFHYLNNEDNLPHNLETQLKIFYATHPRPLTSALNGIAVLERNGIAFDEKLISDCFARLTPESQKYGLSLLTKYLPADAIKHNQQK